MLYLEKKYAFETDSFKVDSVDKMTVEAVYSAPIYCKVCAKKKEVVDQ